ncbi:MAG: hypothetical protein ABL977_02070 [Candidatus Eisenbacteria bacterium]
MARLGTRSRAPIPLCVALVLAFPGLLTREAWAVMDIKNNGPVLDAGRYAMRITNIGVLGNPYFNKGLSFDPSFEFPKGSGHECLEHAELWIGATRDDGSSSVSGGPMLEWRPTLEPTDVVQRRYAGDRGTRATFDDDGDGVVDEEFLDGLDNDGDGEVDEDLRFPAQESCASTFVDDRPEAVDFGFENGERHRPFGLTVKQEAHSWAVPGFEKAAGIHFTITNHGRETLHEVRLGVYADLDSRDRRGGGHLDDAVTFLSDSLTMSEGTSTVNAVWSKRCFTTLAGRWPAVHDAAASSGAPWAAVLGLSHTTDPLGFLVNTAFPGVPEAMAAARAPRRDSTFTYSIFSSSQPPGQGGPPVLDIDRVAALRGEFPESSIGEARDYAVLVRCGPFRILEPGQSLEFSIGFIAAEDADSLIAAAQSARLAWRGTALNRLPDIPGSRTHVDGVSGIGGHEICYEPPPGVVFHYDPHCPEKFLTDPAYRPFPSVFPPSEEVELVYRAGGGCIWTDFDCDACTGFTGADTPAHWYLRAPAPPQPLFRAEPGDRQVRVEWDNLPEILADAGIMPGAPWTFSGYRIYRLDRWNRESLLPPTTRWQQIASFGVDTTLGSRPLAEAVDTAVEYDSVAYERKHYPVGRYAFVDRRVLDGFDYHYVVTSVVQRSSPIPGANFTEYLESPFRTVFTGVVRPRAEAGVAYRDGQVWVVPNPFRARVEWEREPVPGDVFTRHVDFFGLPRAKSRIKIYTLAGDLVQELQHDGTTGNGQAPWNLISRNGQDIESGVYLFTVDSPAGHQTGRFVIIR